MKIRCTSHNRRVVIFPRPLGIPQITVHRDDGSHCDVTTAYFMGPNVISFRAVDHHVLVMRKR